MTVAGDEPLAGVDQRRQAGFRVGGDSEIDFGVGPEVLVVALRQQVA